MPTQVRNDVEPTDGFGVCLTLDARIQKEKEKFCRAFWFLDVMQKWW
jgi:hypothetical protein